MNVHVSPSPPVTVVFAVVSPTFVPSTVSNVIFNTVSFAGLTGSTVPLIGSTVSVTPDAAPNGTETVVYFSSPSASL